MKVCKKCGAEKLPSEFGKVKRNKDGLSGSCKSCDNAYKLQWLKDHPESRTASLEKYESENQERIRQSKTAYYIKNRDGVILKASEWKKGNKESVSASSARRYIRKRERILAYNRAWIRANLDLARAACHRRRARKLSADGRHTAADIQRLLKLQRGCCAACHKPMKTYHVDHRIALSRGGSNHWTNLQLLHPRCNQEKHAKDPIRFMQSRGFLL